MKKLKVDEKNMILSGDIGGTNTRLAFFEGTTLVSEHKFKSKDHKSLEEIIQLFLESQKMEVTKACFGVAGPVVDGKCKATNLPWLVDVSNLRGVCGTSDVFLLNDLETKAYGIRVLKKEELHVIHPGDPEQKGNQALIAAGTGLGEAGLFFDGKEHHPFACEGGHVDFAPRNDLEIELFHFLREKLTHISYERVVSGPGIYLLYRFLTESGKVKESKEVAELMKTEPPPLVVTKMAKKIKDPACVKTIELFLSLYGAEAGNLALKMMSLGGFYIGGGIAPSLVEEMKTGEFLKSFMAKGRFQPFLESIPIYVILNDDASLLGAAFYAQNQ